MNLRSERRTEIVEEIQKNAVPESDDYRFAVKFIRITFSVEFDSGLCVFTHRPFIHTLYKRQSHYHCGERHLRSHGEFNLPSCAQALLAGAPF